MSDKGKPVGIALSPSFIDRNGDTWVNMQLTPHGMRLLMDGKLTSEDECE